MAATKRRTSKRFQSADQRWTAIVDRDAAAEGEFVYAVRTTGVYCRPSCASRQPRRENVLYYPSPLAAKRAGFRPCKRCRPDRKSSTNHHADVVVRACRSIEAATALPNVAALAAAAGLSRSHFQRIFKIHTGLTPKAYASGIRARWLKDAIVGSKTIVGAMHRAGFNSASRLYEKSGQLLGMTPSAFRAGGARATIRFAPCECTLGAVLVAATEKGVCAISLGDDPRVMQQDLQSRFPDAELVGGDRSFNRLVARVVDLIESPSLGHDLPLDVRGTAFQLRVWNALTNIPPGRTASYAALAAQLGRPNAARAVARACAANELAVAIPCHRVVHKGGGISGYRWGVERKRALLARECELLLPQAGRDGGD
jgi:AraC family transcriptional regulator of adaptative response/methylated-DNA-[protein]-cysteine methyltransferase